MRNVIFFIAILLASCGTSHKLKQSQEKTADSVATITRDSSRVTKEVNHSSNTTARDVHVRINYAPLDSSLLAYMLGLAGDDTDDIKTVPKAAPSTRKASIPAKTGNKVIDAIQDAISAAGGAGRIPSSVQIDIGSIGDSTYQIEKVDSTGTHLTEATDVHTTEKSKSKEVTHEGVPTIARLALWLLVILVIAGIIYRYRTKLVLVKNFIVKILNI